MMLTGWFGPARRDMSTIDPSAAFFAPAVSLPAVFHAALSASTICAWSKPWLLSSSSDLVTLPLLRVTISAAISAGVFPVRTGG